MKKANIINKIKGILIILIGLLLAVAGVWLYSKIWGTNLLFTDSSLGKVARFYWIFLIAAVIVVVLGVCKFRKRVAAVPEQETGDQTEAQDAQTQSDIAPAQAETPKKSLMRKKTGSTCPNCNKPIGKGNKFCTSCGHKLV